MQNLDRQLSIADGHFFGGTKPSHADFNVFHHLNNATLVEPDCVTSTRLMDWMERMLAIRGLEEWLEERPKHPN